jgi:hypothetical protein
MLTDEVVRLCILDSKLEVYFRTNYKSVAFTRTKVWSAGTPSQLQKKKAGRSLGGCESQKG